MQDQQRLFTVELSRKKIQTTKPTDTHDTYVLGALHTCLVIPIRLRIPARLGVWLMNRQRVKQGLAAIPYIK